MLVIFMDRETAIGGAEKHVLDLANHAHTKGFRVTLIHDNLTLQHASEKSLNNSETIQWEYIKNSGKDAEIGKIILKLIKLFKKHKPDLIHGHKLKAAILSRIAGRIMRIPVVTTLHGSPSRWEISPMNKRFNIFLNRLTSNSLTARAVAVSIGEREDMIQREKIHPEKIILVPNLLKNRNTFKMSSPFSQERIVITTVARLSPQKGHEDIINAAQKILAHKKNVLLQWIGDGELRPMLESKIRELGLEKNFHLLGEQAPEKIQKVLETSDIFLHPSLWEGLPYAVMEAMASSLPIIATDINGHRELINHMEHGLLVPVHAPSEIARNTIFLINHPELARRLGKNARNRILSQYHMSNSFETITQLYESIIKKKNKKITIMMVITVGQTEYMFGGAERFLIDLCRNLNDGKYQLIIVTDNQDFLNLLARELPSKNIMYDRITCQPKDFFDAKILWSLLKLIKKYDPDIIHAHKLKSSFWSRIAGKISGKKVITQMHTIPSHWNISPLKKKIQNIVNGITTDLLTDRSIAVSQEEKYAMISEEKIQPHRIRVVYKGVFHQQNIQAKPLQKETVEIVTVARLSREKGHDVLLQSAMQLRMQFPRIHYTWIGTGPEKARLEKTVRANDLDEIIHVAGFQSSAEIAKNLATADIFVLPSLWETLPYALGEAALACLPLIASDIPGVREFVVHERTGLLVPPQDPLKLSEAIKKTLEQPIHARQWGQAAARRARFLFNGQNMMEQIENIYSSL